MEQRKQCVWLLLARVGLVSVCLFLFYGSGLAIFALGMTRAATSWELWGTLLGVLGLGWVASLLGKRLGIPIAWMVTACCVPIWLLTVTLGMLQPPFVVLAIGLPVVMWLARNQVRPFT